VIGILIKAAVRRWKRLEFTATRLTRPFPGQDLANVKGELDQVCVDVSHGSKKTRWRACSLSSMRMP
jgi:hypothetical protein